MATLYIVSTPIGNLGDITNRAVDVLSSVDRVLAEDTRRTAILFRRYGITTPLRSAYAHNEAARAEDTVAWLDAGETLALVSDAGTPTLSDPGLRLVRAALDAGHEVVPVPGASALLAALAVSAIETTPFTFYGFPPRGGKARAERLSEIAGLAHTAVLYESPKRLPRLLADLVESCGGERRAAVARELTKRHETVVRGTLAELAAYYDGEPIRGEVVVVVDGAGGAAAPEPVAAHALARSLLDAGERPSAVARTLAERLGLARNEAYSIALAESEEMGDVD